ncbi:MAG: amidohydrolase [Oscillospiraceae bacterium]|nr:amidohydrolase [Oscillospiraceae bacterium]
MDTLFSHATVVTMDEQMRVYLDAFVGVQGGKISYLSKKPPEEQPQMIVDGTGMVLMPGLINCHTHLPMSILRGYADDQALAQWLNESIFPREDRLDGRAVKAAALLSIAECLRFGVTSVSDMYNFCDEIAEAVDESGIKANLSRATMLFSEEDFDFDADPRCREMVALHEKWHNYDHGRILVDASIHAEYTSNYVLWEAVSKYASNNNLSMHVHLSETRDEHESCKEKYGLTPAQLLDCHHVFDNGGIAAHCVWLEEEDRKLLAKRKISAVHCPVSNAKLSSGTADVMAMVKAGMNVALGTDGAASNNNLDLFEEIKTASLLAKLKTGDPTALNAQAALMMATVCGARAQRRERECGMIKLGMDADLILLDFTQPHLIPCHNVISNLVYAASGHDVCLTMVRGKILYAAGKYHTIDLKEVMKELGGYAMPKVFAEKD